MTETESGELLGETVTARMELSRLIMRTNYHGAEGRAERRSSLSNDNLLFKAVDNGFTHAARLLVDARGANVNATSWNCWTPLHCAATSGHRLAAELLIDRGADINARADEGSRPIHQAIYEGHLETSRLLLERGAEPNARDKDGWAPIHYSAMNGNVLATALLLEMGADANAKTKRGAVPLLLAVSNKHREVVHLLVRQRNIKLHIVDKNNETVIDRCRDGREGGIDEIRALLNHCLHEQLVDFANSYMTIVDFDLYRVIHPSLFSFCF